MAYQAKHPHLDFASLIMRTFIHRWLLGLLAMSSFVCCFLLQPFWAGSLLQYIADKAAGRYDDNSTYFMGIHSGYGIASGLVITSLIAILSINNTFYHQTRFGTLLRSAVRRNGEEKRRQHPSSTRRSALSSFIISLLYTTLSPLSMYNRS